MRLLALLFIFLCPLHAIAQEPGKVFNAETYTLENGLQVVVIPNHRAPVVTHMVWYKVGAADEPAGKSGIAHFLEHLMFKGSEGLKPGEFSERVKAMGGNDNAFTTQDYTAFYQSVSADHLEDVMRMEAGRLRGLALAPAEVDSERQVILEERRQRIDNDPKAKFGEQLSADLFVNHPYGTPVIGWFHEMESLSRDDAKNFYDTWYGPNNAILVVSGDVTGPQVYDLAKKIYGGLKQVPVPERRRTKSPPLNSLTRLTLRHESIRQPMTEIVFRVPSSHESKDESLALQVLEDIMGGGPTSRLYKSLVVEQKIAASASFSYNSDAWDDGTVTLFASLAPGKTPEAVESALNNELRKLVRDGVSPQELEEAKSRLQDEAVYALDSLTGPAMIFGQALATGSSVDDIEYWPRDIAKVTAAQVQAAAQKYLDPDHYGDSPPVTGYLLPAAQTEPAAGSGQEQPPAATEGTVP